MQVINARECKVNWSHRLRQNRFGTQTQITECKGVSVKRGPDTCGWRMRMGKCGKNKTRNGDGKNKQTNKRKKSFFQVSVAWLGPSCKVCVLNSWHRLLRVFSQFFEPCDSFHWCHRNKDAPFLLLKIAHAMVPFLLWVDSLDIVYSTYRRENIFRAIKSRIFGLSASRQKITA